MTAKTKKTGLKIFISLLTFGLAVLFLFLDTFSFIENKLYDSRMKFASKYIEPSEEICFIALDQESLDWAQEEMGWAWPWPRSAYADIVNYFSLAEANALVFDVLFTEPSVYGPEDDEIFAKACKENGKVIQTIYESEEGSAPLEPISIIKESANSLGSITSAIDDDDIIRRGRLFHTIGETLYPSLGLAPLFLEEDSEFVIGTLSESTSFINPDSTVYLRFQSSIDDYIPYRASDILKSYYALTRGEEPLLPPENFTDTYTFFAFYAPGLFDICSVPNNQVYPGVGVHITLLDNVLNQQFIQKSHIAITISWIFFLSFWGMCCVWISESQKSTRKTVFTLIILLIISVALIIVLPYYLFTLGIWLNITLPGFAYFASFLLAFFISYSQEGKQRRFIKNAFQQYVSPSVIENLIQNPDKLKLGGEKRNLSIFFSDIQGFTSISENISPEELTDFLNDFLSEMSNIILKSGGTIDKYEGDAIIAFWNAPTSVEDHQLKALYAAMECQKKLEDMRPSYTTRLGSPVFMRIGINSGDAVVGNLGSRERFDYTMIGDSVNLAARLEGLNKEFGTYTMCSKATKDAAIKSGAEVFWRELARVAVVGKKTAVTVFEPLSKALYSEKKIVFDIFDQARELFYQGKFEKARMLFASIAEEDKPAAAYEKKCEKLIEQLSEGSNLENWKGIWVASSK